MSVATSKPRAEYPRPIIQRDEWINLNGYWQFREDRSDLGLMEQWHINGLGAGGEKILVPFAVESEASGVHNIAPASIVWYETTFSTPAAWQSRVCLRFGAVDHWARVFVNGQEVGQHRGGYAPFGFDIEHALQAGDNRLTVRVEDSLSWTQPRGKQAGTTRWPIDYDSVTGIWQTVWLEPLPKVSIENTSASYSLEQQVLTLTTGFSRQVEGELSARLLRDGHIVASGTVETNLRAEARLQLQVSDPVLWDSETPELYDLRLTLIDRLSGETDEVLSYTGLREIAVNNGCLMLNGRPLYLRGILDQGYFPGGWYTATSDDDIRKDVELTLAMGLNCARKHQKAEDPRYLYWADKLGLLVWAEMPSGKIFSTELVETLTAEWTALIKRDRAHPSVIAWVPFNESWGVWHQAERPEQRAFVEGVAGLTRALDPSRPVVGNDGWEYAAGDLWTLHLYYSGEDINTRLQALIDEPATVVTGDEGEGRQRIGALPGSRVEGLPILLTECGGVGYGRYSDEDFSYGDLPVTTRALEKDIRDIASMVDSGAALQGFVWTQLTDIQQEINGLLYFDRTPKLPLATLREIFTAIGKSR